MSSIRLSEVVGEGYHDFWHTRKRYRIVKGSRGSKKSTTASLWYITQMMKPKYSEANLLVIRDIHKDHKDSTFAQLKWSINRLGVERFWKTTVSPLEMIYIPTGQKILFRGLDNPLSITSMTVEKGYLCWVWFEEIYQVKTEDDFDKVDLSIRGQVPEPLFKQITGTFNPWNEMHWLKKKFFDYESDQIFAQTVNYMCNEFLGADDIQLFEEMKIRFPERYKVEGLGDWGVTGDVVYSNYVVKEFDITQFDDCAYDGLDFGFNHPSAYVHIGFKDDEFWICKEFYQRGLTNTELIPKIKAIHNMSNLITADSAEPARIKEFQRAGFRIVKSKKGKGSIKDGIDFIRNYKINIHPTCRNFISEIMSYAYQTDSEGNTMEEPIDFNNHLMDAMRYGVERLTFRKQLRAVARI